jgi:hypothetical protein
MHRLSRKFQLIPHKPTSSLETKSAARRALPGAPDGQNANGSGWLRTALGQTLPTSHVRTESALPSTPDQGETSEHVCFMPTCDIATPQTKGVAIKFLILVARRPQHRTRPPAKKIQGSNATKNITPPLKRRATRWNTRRWCRFEIRRPINHSFVIEGSAN